MSGLVATNTAVKVSQNFAFQALTRETKKQVCVDEAFIGEWDFSIELDYTDLHTLNSAWLTGLNKQIAKKRKKKETISADEKTVTLVVTPKAFLFQAKNSKDFSSSTPTGLAKGEEFEMTFRGKEFTDIFRMLEENDRLTKITLNGLEAGLLQIEAVEPEATYLISIPTVLADSRSHNSKYFTHLR